MSIDILSVLSLECLENILLKSLNVYDFFQNIKSLYSNLLSAAGCLSTIVNATCGKEAASFYIELYIITIEPLQQRHLPSCNLRGN